MPTYEYECTKCGTVTEVFQSITAATKRRLKKTDEPQCDCNASVVRRIGSGAGIIFKGAGFYETDYRSENYKKGVKAEKEAKDKKSEASDKKTEGTKSETKKKPKPTAKEE